MLFTRIIYCLCFVLSLSVFSACAPKKPLTAEEMLLRDAYADCKRDADEMSDPPRNSDNRLWDSYFTMCMKTRYGYSTEQVRALWR